MGKDALSWTAGLLALLVLAGCRDAGEPAPSRVVMRLGPSYFESVPVAYHVAAAPIGDEARAVVFVPESEPVLSLFALAPDEDGRVRAEIELPEAVRELPQAAFTLQVQRLPAQATPELLSQMSRTILSRQIVEGWQLERGDAGRATLVYTHDDPVEAHHRYSLHLRALKPGPVRLRSRSFEAPPGATLELAYGLTTVPGAAGSVPVRFHAELECEGESQAVVDVTVPAAGESGWREVAGPLPEDGGSCRLDLSASDRGGGAVRGAVWAVPRIHAPPERPRSAADRNVVMISLDTLRADHLSGFGYPRPTSPRIDADLIARGTSFLDVTSTYSRTDVSHLSLFTGLYPEARPERARLQAPTPVPTLAEQLRDAGFETAAFTEDGLIAGVFGFWFGFDRFSERAYRHEERATPIFEDGIDYVRQHRNRPFFLFLHTYKTHAPYYASPPYQELFRDPADWDTPGMSAVPRKHRPLADEYDRTIREADELVGRLVAEIDRLGLGDRTLVVLLSDHGESFGDHGVVGHSYSGDQEVIRVPLILRGPGVPAGRSVETPVSLVDVAPTTLEFLGVPGPKVTQGLSLLPALRGESLPSRRSIHFSWLADGAAGVRYGSYKYRRSDHGRSTLFDLDSDPGERNPLAGRPTRPLAERLIADHEQASAKLRRAFEAGTLASDTAATPLSPEVEASLRALGYIE